MQFCAVHFARGQAVENERFERNHVFYVTVCVLLFVLDMHVFSASYNNNQSLHAVCTVFVSHACEMNDDCPFN